jgi:hypothetical protein
MDDRARVEQLLGRPPRGDFDVVVRDDDGDPVVVRNAPLLDDGTPMPTRFYLVGRVLVRSVSRLEGAGGVREAERSIDADEIAAVHQRYASERDTAIPEGHTGPRPSGGVGGTRTGLKCLHAHVANELAGGDDPVGRWALERLDQIDRRGQPVDVEPVDAEEGVLTIDIFDRSLTLAMSGRDSFEVPIGPMTLLDDLAGGDLPAPASLTNALGAVHDHLDDLLIGVPEMAKPTAVTIRGEHAVSLARVEHGSEVLPTDYQLSRSGADEVFRTVVGEPPSERAQNPGLDAAYVHTIVATCCIALGVMRRLELDGIRVDPTTARSGGASPGTSPG